MWYPLYRRLGGSQSWSGRCGEEENVSSLPCLEPHLLGVPAYNLIAISAELSQLPS
jgi:hypothetical protein